MEKLAKFTLLVGTLSLSSCGLHGNALDSLFSEETSTSIKEFFPKKSSSLEEESSISSQKSTRSVYTGNYDKVDVDLSNYSDTMAYTEALYIADHIEDYRGKSMKIKGFFKAYESTWVGYYFYACEVMDNTACCSIYFEFVPRDTLNYPTDFPEEDAVITVAGFFDPYTEEHEGKTYIYCNLIDAVML